MFPPAQYRNPDHKNLEAVLRCSEDASRFFIDKTKSSLYLKDF